MQRAYVYGANRRAGSVWENDSYRHAGELFG